MRELILQTSCFGVLLSLLAYFIGLWIKRKFHHPLLNPLLIAMVLSVSCLVILKVDYESYASSARYLTILLTPATVCLAIPLYEQLHMLKANPSAILLGVIAGVLSGLGCILLLSLAFGLNHVEYVTLLPKSITTAIGMALSEELGGIPAITTAAIIITGIMGNVFAEGILKLARIRVPLARGLAIGTASHAMGTAKALELGEVEGAMSGLAIAVAGLLTVVGASVFASFL